MSFLRFWRWNKQPHRGNKHFRRHYRKIENATMAAGGGGLHQKLGRSKELEWALGKLSSILTDLCLSQRWRRVEDMGACLHIAVLWYHCRQQRQVQYSGSTQHSNAVATFVKIVSPGRQRTTKAEVRGVIYLVFSSIFFSSECMLCWKWALVH